MEDKMRTITKKHEERKHASKKRENLLESKILCVSKEMNNYHPDHLYIAGECGARLREGRPSVYQEQRYVVKLTNTVHMNAHMCQCCYFQVCDETDASYGFTMISSDKSSKH